MDGIRAKAEADLKMAEARYEAAHSHSVSAQADEDAALEHLNRMRTVWEWVQAQGGPEEQSGAGERGEEPQARPRIVFGKPVPEVTLTDRCFETLVTFGRAASTKQILKHLATEGHEYTLDQVRSTLRYLSQKKPPLVETSSGSGIWRLSKTAKAKVAETSFIPAAGAAGMSTAGENGSAVHDGAVPAGAGLNSQPARQSSF